MVMLQRVVLALGVASAAASSPSHFEPSTDVVRENAFHIFNSVHSAMRQFGSSLHHNGLSFFPATIPRGTLFYHGNHRKEAPAGPEWLAFEMEHAHAFGFSRRPNDSIVPPHGDDNDEPTQGRGEQIPLGGVDGKVEDDRKGVIRGFIHTFQTTRDLKILYLDGMAAAKTAMGTLDTQDHVLLNGMKPVDDIVQQELNRAADICELVTSWGYDGYIRMEIGFELIKCDFSTGLQEVAVMRQPTLKTPSGKKDPMAPPKGPMVLEYLLLIIRGATQRFEGIGGGRVRLDFSHATSGFFYPVNTSSSFAERPDLVRIGSAETVERDAIREITKTKAIASLEGNGGVDWQGVTDMVVTRYNDRIAALASGKITPAMFAREVEEIVIAFTDEDPEGDDLVPLPGSWPGLRRRALKDDPDALGRCRDHHLLPVRVFEDDWTETDYMFALAIETVTEAICKTFLDAAVVVEVEEPQVDEYVQRFAALKEKLDWWTWKRCGQCAPDEMCMVAMWPMGDHEDHWAPSCKTADRIVPGTAPGGYWDLGMKW